MGARKSRDVRRISIHALLAESDSRHFAGVSEDCNFYPRSPCGERPAPPSPPKARVLYFYPRSPCGERPDQPRELAPAQQISIHALLAESDLVNGGGLSSCLGNFYPRSPCGERLLGALWVLSTLIFLSTLSLRRATGSAKGISSCTADFYPRSPCGERQ